MQTFIAVFVALLAVTMAFNTGKLYKSAQLTHCEEESMGKLSTSRVTPQRLFCVFESCFMVSCVENEEIRIDGSFLRANFILFFLLFLFAL